MPEMVWLAILMGELLIPLKAPLAPPNTRWVQSGSLMLPSVPGNRVLAWVGLHWFRMVAVAMVAISPVTLIEYQSADMLNPSRKVGVSTTPPEMVRAISGTRLMLPVTLVKTCWLTPVLGYLMLPLLIEAGLNSSV